MRISRCSGAYASAKATASARSPATSSAPAAPSASSITRSRGCPGTRRPSSAAVSPEVVATLEGYGLARTRVFRPTFRDGHADVLPELEREFGFEPPREHGYDTQKALKAMHEGKVKVFFGMGGNFVVAPADTEHSAEAIAARRSASAAHRYGPATSSAATTTG